MKPRNVLGDGPGRVAGFLFLSLIPLTALVPVGPIPAWLAMDLAVRVAAGLGFLICFSSLILRSPNRASVELDFLNLTVLALAAWVLFSVKNSKEAFESFYAFRNFSVMVVLWFSLRVIWENRPGLYPWFERIFLWTSSLAAAWLCVTTLGHATSLSFFQAIVPRKGFFINENVAAGYLGLALLWSLLQRLHSRPISLWAIGLLFLGLTLTQSRGALLALLLVAVFYLLLHMSEVEKRLRSWKTGQWILFGGVILVFLVCSSFTLHKLFNPLEVDPRASNRWDLWVGGFKMALAQPLLGFGPGTFQDAFASYKPASIWNAYVVAAHNEYLQATVECGWPALLLILVFLGVLFRETGRRLKSTPAFKAVPADLLASENAFFLVLFEAIHNGVDFTFHEWSHRVVLLAVVTYALKGKKPMEAIRATFHFSRRTFGLGCGLAGAAVLWILVVGGFRDFLARMDDVKGSLAFKQNDLEGAEAYARQSLRFRGDLMPSWNLLGAVADVRGERTDSPVEKKKYFQLAERDYDKSAQLAPYSLEPLENKVHFLVVQRRLSEALELQNRLVDLAPQNPVELIQRAQILLAMGRAQDSIASAQMAVDLDDYFIPGYVAKAKAMEALGKRADAVLIDKKIEDIIRKQGIPDLPERLEKVEADIRRLEGRPE